MNKERLREAIMLSLGEASMCWSGMPTGVFDERHAIEIGNRLLKVIEDMTLAHCPICGNVECDHMLIDAFIKPPLPPQPKPTPKPTPKPPRPKPKP